MYSSRPHHRNCGLYMLLTAIVHDSNKQKGECVCAAHAYTTRAVASGLALNGRGTTWGKGYCMAPAHSVRTLAPLWSNSVRAYTAPGRGRGVTGRWGPQPGCVLLQKQHWICCISHAYFCRQAAPGIEALRPTHNRSLRLRRLSCTAAAEAAAWVLYVR